MNLKKTGCEDADWLNMSEDNELLQYPEKSAINFLVLQKSGNLLSGRATVSISRASSGHWSPVVEMFYFKILSLTSP